jgi:hypothetical protein
MGSLMSVDIFMKYNGSRHFVVPIDYDDHPRVGYVKVILEIDVFYKNVLKYGYNYIKYPIKREKICQNF